MSNETVDSSEREQRLDEVILAYLNAVDAGQTIERQEWLERYPDLAPELTSFFNHQDQVEPFVSLLRGPALDPYRMAHALLDFPGDQGGSIARPTLDQVPAAGPDTLEPGTRVDECVIERRLGGGGMGEVYLALHEVLRCHVAVKVLPLSRANDPQAVQRFEREVQLLAQMEPHPNLVAARHAATHDGRLYLMMDYVAGQNLAKLVASAGPLAPAQACACIRQAAVGLDHAHRRNIVHRDIKPSNLMVTEDGAVKILDLGLARLMAPATVQEDGARTSPGVILGTWDYVSPEQTENASAADPRSDLYSLGCTFYYLLTGRVVFPTPLPADKLKAHASEPPEPVQRVRPEVPPAVAAVVDRLLAKRPEDRFPSAQALIEALDDALRPRRPWGWKTWLLGAVAGLAMAAGTWTLFFYPSHSAEVPLAGELIIRVWSPDGETKPGLKVDEPGALPVREKDWIHVEVRLNQPAYVYVLWLESQGEVTALYPWNDNEIVRAATVPPPRRPPARIVHSPQRVTRGWPADDKEGLETVLLLVRRTPLPADQSLRKLIGEVPSAKLNDPHELALLSLDRSQAVGKIAISENRGIKKKAEEIDAPMLQLMGRLRDEFELIRAVRFAHRGP
jgi:hypothetical protein